MMRSQGPSPWIPLLMVGVLSYVIFGDTMRSVAEIVLSLLLPGEDEEDDGDGDGTTISIFHTIILLLLIHFLTVFSPTLSIFSASKPRSESSGYDAEGFGLGSLLLIVLFFILHNIF
ncbi:hypothetical protein Vadar_021488 [Vaccinium darrowii]|uniref:Uncharacterized protein n=1 Tax=Vaccinium darrowii TaxID=229202 RepID=A0ACB7ZE96_9ERIC|nr:hypothetical protein Vadar_021488 [Vaccinium darrowii]